MSIAESARADFSDNDDGSTQETGGRMRVARPELFHDDREKLDDWLT